MAILQFGFQIVWTMIQTLSTIRNPNLFIIQAPTVLKTHYQKELESIIKSLKRIRCKNTTKTLNKTPWSIYHIVRILTIAYVLQNQKHHLKTGTVFKCLVPCKNRTFKYHSKTEPKKVWYANVYGIRISSVFKCWMVGNLKGIRTNIFNIQMLF